MENDFNEFQRPQFSRQQLLLAKMGGICDGLVIVGGAEMVAHGVGDTGTAAVAVGLAFRGLQLLVLRQIKRERHEI